MRLQLFRLLLPIGLAGAQSIVSTTSSLAQTQDEARLIVGLSLGYMRQTPLYDVALQPIISGTGYPSAYQLRREIRPNVTASGHMTYFRGPRIGVSLEFTYLGLGTTDHCTLAQDGGDVDLRSACDALDGAQRSPATSEILAGFILRPLPQSPLQPYVKAQGGIAFTPTSTVYTVSEYRTRGGLNGILTVYNDDSAHTIRPAWTAAVGVSTAPHTGYQIRVELREAWLPLSTVTGPALVQGVTPPLKTAIKGFGSIVVGFDVVLAKQRGRRY